MALTDSGAVNSDRWCKANSPSASRNSATPTSAKRLDPSAISRDSFISASLANGVRVVKLVSFPFERCRQVRNSCCGAGGVGKTTTAINLANITSETFEAAKPFDFMAMTLFKMYASGENVGELNPFEGNNTVSFGLKKGKPVIANMVFDFKKPPKDAELSCVSTIKAGGEKVYFQLGF